MKEKHFYIEKIKSKFILKKILSLLWEHKKLDLIIYNKQLQNKLLLIWRTIKMQVINIKLKEQMVKEKNI